MRNEPLPPRRSITTFASRLSRLAKLPPLPSIDCLTVSKPQVVSILLAATVPLGPIGCGSAPVVERSSTISSEIGSRPYEPASYAIGALPGFARPHFYIIAEEYTPGPATSVPDSSAIDLLSAVHAHKLRIVPSQTSEDDTYSRHSQGILLRVPEGRARLYIRNIGPFFQDAFTNWGHDFDLVIRFAPVALTDTIKTVYVRLLPEWFHRQALLDAMIRQELADNNADTSVKTTASLLPPEYNSLAPQDAVVKYFMDRLIQKQFVVPIRAKSGSIIFYWVTNNFLELDREMKTIASQVGFTRDSVLRIEQAMLRRKAGPEICVTGIQKIKGTAEVRIPFASFLDPSVYPNNTWHVKGFGLLTREAPRTLDFLYSKRVSETPAPLANTFFARYSAGTEGLNKVPVNVNVPGEEVSIISIRLEPTARR